MIKPLIVLILFYTPLHLFSQNIENTFLSKIITHQSPVQIFSFNLPVDPIPILKINDLQNTFNFTGQGLTKNKNGLFLNPIGTGRLYKWNGDSKKGNWQRIDSTFFSGYNFLSLFFSIDSSLYSFGGIGFWHINGNLRKYNFSANEWNAKLLTSSIPWHQDTKKYYYIDSSQKMIYFSGSGKTADQSLASTVDSNSINSIYSLDIERGELKTLGKFNIEDAGFLGQTPWGTVSSFTILSDFKNNIKYKLSERVENNLMRVLAKANNNRFTWQYSFWLDSALYFGSSNYLYDSVIISKSDLIETKDKVYTPLEFEKYEQKFNANSSLNLLLIFILLGSNLIFIIAYYSQRSKNNNSSSTIKEREKKVEKYILTEIEKYLLRLILDNSIKNKMTSIDEINIVLGSVNKNLEIQKRLRSETINEINAKLSVILLRNEKIINRKRTEFDARSFEYYIDKIYFSGIQKLLNSDDSI